ncbi:S-adenosyl-L-methionine-dependent methyltransferase [Hyaloscypha finlandica]|nr:S-adenosyl-L-methionine-dependent methyltransferase [Hyaloscypha finlandica]
MADTHPPTAAATNVEADLEAEDSAFEDNESQTRRRYKSHVVLELDSILICLGQNGRRYHGYKDGVYLVPNGELEQNRLDLAHHAYTMGKKGKLYLAPIDNPARVLGSLFESNFDRSIHPESHVIGTDLSPIQPPWVAPNVEFIIEDAEDEWIGAPYDYIHIRTLMGAIKDWPRLLTNAFNHLNPGGWIEICDFEPVSDVVKWTDGLHEAASKFGRRMDVATHMHEWVHNAGYSEVVQHIATIPVGNWPKDKKLETLGMYQLANMLDGVSYFNKYGPTHFTRVLGWTAQEYDVFAAKVRTQMKMQSSQLYADLYTVYGQKPKTAG